MARYGVTDLFRAVGYGVVVLGLFVPATFAVGQTPTQANARHAGGAMSSADLALLHAALDDYDAGRLATAEPALRGLVLKYPRNFQADAALGSLYAETGELEKALNLFAGGGTY